MIAIDYAGKYLDAAEMEVAGKAAVEVNYSLPSKRDLVMNSVDELISCYDSLLQLVVAFGGLVVKDAELIKNVSEAFAKTDLSAAGNNDNVSWETTLFQARINHAVTMVNRAISSSGTNK